MDEILNAISKYYYGKIKRMKIGQIAKEMPKEFTVNISEEDVNKYGNAAVEEYFALKRIDYLVNAGIIMESTADRLITSVQRRIVLAERLGYIYLNTEDQGEVDNIQTELAAVDELLNSFHLLDNPFNPIFNDSYNFLNEYSRLRFAEARTLVVSIIDGFNINNSDEEELSDPHRLTDDKMKKIFYLNHKMTPEEKSKTDSLWNRIKEFLVITDGAKGIIDFQQHMPNTICYRENVGYIGFSDDKNYVAINYYGNTEDSAFLNILDLYEFGLSYYRNDILNEMFQNINPGSTAIPIESRENSAQCAIMQFHKFYGNNIPQILIDNYKRIFAVPVEYDPDRVCFVRAEKNAERKLTTQGEE